MTAGREAHLRSVGYLGPYEAREVWALVDELRAKNVAPECFHKWAWSQATQRDLCLRCGFTK